MISTIETGLSGLTAGFTFAHAIAENALFAIRLTQWAGPTRVDDLLRLLWVMIGSVVILSDNPVIKASATGVIAFPTDIANVILTILMASHNTDDQATLALGRHVLFSILHVLVFWPGLVLDCVLADETTAIYNTAAAAVNLLVMIRLSSIPNAL